MTARETPPRGPRVFAPDDPALSDVAERADPAATSAASGPAPNLEGPLVVPTGAEVARGIGWGAVFLAAMGGLVGLAASVWLARFVTVALERTDWVGWTASGLLAVAGVAGAVIAVREVVGLLRLARLGELRRLADAALRDRDLAGEREVAGALTRLYGGRPDLAWALARLKEHQGDVRYVGEHLVLADRELLAPLDAAARRLILTAAKRVAMVTALSPLALIAVGFVLVENLRLLRALATLYGGRPGVIGGLRLARLVVSHLIATGGIALTDDLLGQFLGQDMLRRLSRRLGEGAFNGALTARVGVAAIEVCRPLPYVSAKPVRVRDIVVELFRRTPAAGTPAPLKPRAEDRA